MDKRDQTERDAFNHGYLLAVATMLHQHDCPVTAEDALREAGFTWAKVKALGLCDFDLKLLRPIFREMERKQKETQGG